MDENQISRICLKSDLTDVFENKKQQQQHGNIFKNQICKSNTLQSDVYWATSKRECMKWFALHLLVLVWHWHLLFAAFILWEISIAEPPYLFLKVQRHHGLVNQTN